MEKNADRQRTLDQGTPRTYLETLTDAGMSKLDALRLLNGTQGPLGGFGPRLRPLPEKGNRAISVLVAGAVSPESAPSLAKVIHINRRGAHRTNTSRKE